jgi:hypothetical protein
MPQATRSDAPPPASQAMILPASKEEGKLIKKRYAVFNFDGRWGPARPFFVGQGEAAPPAVCPGAALPPLKVPPTTPHSPPLPFHTLLLPPPAWRSSRALRSSGAAS